MLNRKISKELLDKTLEDVTKDLRIGVKHTPKSSPTSSPKAEGPALSLFYAAVPVPELVRRKSLTGSDFNINQHFPGYDANLIDYPGAKDHKLIASIAPTKATLGIFCQELLFNTRIPVTQIIAFGDNQVFANAEPCDSPYGGIYQPTLQYNDVSTRYQRTGTLTVKLDDKVKTAAVSFINLNPDNEGFDDGSLEILAEVFESAYAKNTVIYCDDGKLSGLIILTFELLRNLDQIFLEEPNKHHSATTMAQLLISLRKDRPQLVESKEQLMKAANLAININAHQSTELELVAPKAVRATSASGNEAQYARFGYASSNSPKSSPKHCQLEVEAKRLGHN